MKGYYKIADELFEIHSIYDEVQTMCHDYACAELPKGVSPIVVTTTLEEIREEQKLSDEEMIYEGLKPVAYPESYLETLVVYRKMCSQLPHRGVILMHGSVIAVDGEAYMFTACSGTGKSTHVRLWRQLFGERAVMVNDDKPLVRVRAAEDGHKEIIIYGTPWDGKHHLSTNMSAPLKAICILERGVENEIHRVGAAEAFPMLIQQSFRPDDREGFIRALDLLGDVAENVGLYDLHCNMNPEAARVSYEGMQ